MFVKRILDYSILLSVVSQSVCHSPINDEKIEASVLEELQRKWGVDYAFSGISTFAHLPYVRCLTTPHEQFDIAIIGAPFDTTVTYRPGARFGPKAIRAASARQVGFRSFNARAGINPYMSWPRILDCGDIPITPFDNELALLQMTEAFRELLGRPSFYSTQNANGKKRPTLITLGGDHSIALPALRALKEVYGPVAVLHFDAHLDTWHPSKYPSNWPSAQSAFNHGSMFHLAYQEGLLINSTVHKNVHAGLRTRLNGDGWDDYEDDSSMGWERISTDDIDDIGTKGIIEKIIATLGAEIPVYLSIDIDVIDPGFAPGTGTPEPGGWTVRELVRILRGIEGLNLVGVDIVEVSPAYDHAENTALVAAQVVFEVISSLVKRGLEVPVQRVVKGQVKDEL
ncbi:arginase family-domain-containing protein [Morchella snyderi]|nr:arginase family-domain-containing protein [Morchella snyderi]